VNGKVLTLDRALEDTIPYLFSLLAIVDGDDPLAQMDGQVKKRRTLEAIKRIVLRESLNQPLMVIFEDLHWIDEPTRELLNLLADSIGSAKILLLVNYRPEYQHEWGNRTHYTQLRLDPLGAESAVEMLSSLLGNSIDLQPLKRLIIERTEGNPFFMEETVLVLFDDGALVRNGAVKLNCSLNQLKIPPTVQAILAARIDRLPADEKDLLETLAVIGREFSLTLVRRLLSTSDDELKRMLSDLQLGEFIYEQPAARDIEYIFKHALTREVAYNSILVERRKQIHERAAQAIESLFAASLADHYTALAHHYRRSGNGSKAVSYLHLAAQQAMNRSALAEASSQLTAALELLRTQHDDLKRDRTEIAVRFSLAFCTGFGGDLEASANVLERVRELSEKAGDNVSLFEVLWFLAFLSSGRLDHQRAHVLYERALEIALLQNTSEMVGHVRSLLGYSYLYEGNFTAAINELEQADKLSAIVSSKKRAFDWHVESRAWVSYAYWASGYPQRAVDKSKESLAIARDLKASSLDLASALWFSAALNMQLKNWKIADAHAGEAVKLVTEHGVGSFLAAMILLRGWMLAQKGQIDQGLSEILQCRTDLIRNGPLVLLCWVYRVLAEVYLAAGHLHEGLEAVDEGLELAERTGTRILEAETRRLKGELLLMGNNDAASEAAQCFRDAIEVAQRQSAKSFELRATTSLARLLASQDRRDEARPMLADIYNWFTEGFDTADLKDAKALLEQLGA
jgi:predicted ATPase